MHRWTTGAALCMLNFEMFEAHVCLLYVHECVCGLGASFKYACCSTWTSLQIHEMFIFSINPCSSIIKSSIKTATNYWPTGKLAFLLTDTLCRKKKMIHFAILSHICNFFSFFWCDGLFTVAKHVSRTL